MTAEFFPRWVPVVVVAIVVLGLTAFAVGLVGVYMADEYMTRRLASTASPRRV